MARTARTDSPTKARLLDAAQRLMLTKGYAASTVEEICNTAKLTKGSFFHYFESKEHLGKALLERFCQSAKQQHRQACCEARDPLDRVFKALDCIAHMAERPTSANGCLLGTFAQELSDTHPEIRSLCARGFRDWTTGLKQELDEAKRLRRPKADIDTQSLAEHLVAVVEGSLILAKASRRPAIVRQSLTHVRRYLATLFGERTRK